MLDYISKELQARMHTETDESQSETQMNEAILEYAHLFQELDDLSMKGTSAGSSRPYTKIDIPLEDDIEIDSVEMNLLDGRVTNIPMDATVQESDLTLEHFGMKTYDQIYTETYNSMTQFARETDAAFEERVTAEAAVAYKKYTDQIIQEGLFGFGKINISDNSVPSRITLDFGKHPDKGSYYVKLPIGWQVDKKHRILKKQLESIQVLQKYFDNIGTQLRQILFNQHGAELGIERPYDIWEKITPTEVIVPVDPMDKYCVSFGFEIDGKEGSEAYPYLTWTVPIKGSHNATEKNFTKTSEADIKKLHATTKREAIQEMAYEAEHPMARPSRFFQEAIDFGNPDEAPATDSNAADVSIDTPPADGQAQAAPDAGADVTTDAPATDDNKEAIETNDVSDQIAEKVAADTKADNADNSSDVNIDDLMDDNGTTDATDTNDVDLSDTTDAPTDEELAADIGDEGSTDAEPVEDTSNLDFDNMTIDELLAQGTEKLKGMTIQQLKDFMNSGDTSTEGTEEELAQEAFFLTRGNIGKELDIHLRKTMGVLNNNDMDITELCSQFRKEGKKLNRVVHKASGMKKVFDESERNQLRRLNHVLADLIALMRSDVDDNSVSVVKRLIQAFVSEATAVAKIVESKNPKPVQEAALFLKRKHAPDVIKKNVSLDRLAFIKKNGFFDKIFGKSKKVEQTETSGPSLPNEFPLSADEFKKILKLIENKTKKPCVELSWSSKANPDSVKPTSSVIGGIPPFIAEIPTDKNGKQLRFVIQINFADVPGLSELPSNGIMQFWLDRNMNSGRWNKNDNRYRVLYYSSDDMKKLDKTKELVNQIDMTIYDDRDSVYCFGEKNDQYIVTFKKSENCNAPWSWNEIDDYEKIFIETWNENVSDPEKKLNDSKAYDKIIDMIPKGFSEQIDRKGIFDQYGDKIGGYPGFTQSDFRAYDDVKFTSENCFLLLQLDSTKPIMWGDCGTGQIFITKEALSKCDFSKAVFDWACY